MSYLPGILLVALYSSPLAADNLKPFHSDGCSAFPNGTFEQNSLWLQCCYQHDMAYWRGGTQQERSTADNILKQCVSAVGEPTVALLMLAGICAGGNPYLPTSFRWGYGWPYPRGYKVLSKEELGEVNSRLTLPPPD